MANSTLQPDMSLAISIQASLRVGAECPILCGEHDFGFCARSKGWVSMSVPLTSSIPDPDLAWLTQTVITEADPSFHRHSSGVPDAPGVGAVGWRSGDRIKPRFKVSKIPVATFLASAYNTGHGVLRCAPVTASRRNYSPLFLLCPWHFGVRVGSSDVDHARVFP